MGLFTSCFFKSETGNSRRGRGGQVISIQGTGRSNGKGKRGGGGMVGEGVEMVKIGGSIGTN